MQTVATVTLSDAELAEVLARRQGNAVAVVEQPTPPTISIGDTVIYTGKTSGKTRSYNVGWTGICKYDNVTPKLGLHRYGKKGPLFFVNASDCKLK